MTNKLLSKFNHEFREGVGLQGCATHIFTSWGSVVIGIYAVVFTVSHHFNHISLLLFTSAASQILMRPNRGHKIHIKQEETIVTSTKKKKILPDFYCCLVLLLLSEFVSVCDLLICAICSNLHIIYSSFMYILTLCYDARIRFKKEVIFAFIYSSSPAFKNSLFKFAQ